MFVSKLQTNIRQFFVRKYVRFCIDKRMFVYYNAVIESKQMFAAMQGGYETRKKSYRRTRAKRVKRYTYLSILLSALCLGGITYSKLTVEATQKKAQEPYKYYTEIRVQRGDTLWDIANKYMDSSVYRSLDDYMDEIREINSINYNRIYNGQQLIIPYYSEQLR